ncbi:Derlin-2 [Yarrowia sp. B02]|nr:Derlin-2 [Yarrowia sp. B02]
MDMAVQQLTELPPVTMTFIGGVFTLGLLQFLGFASEIHYIFLWKGIVQRHEYWRFVTPFFYFGKLNIDLALRAYFLSRHPRMLEEGCYRHNVAEYAWIMLFAAANLLLIAVAFPKISPPFLGSSLLSAITYLWARRNEGVRVSLLGVFTFTAPYLPWVTLAMSYIANDEGPGRDHRGRPIKVSHHEEMPQEHGLSGRDKTLIFELIGMFIGHVIFFLEDVYPKFSGGSRPLAPPWVYVQRWLDNSRERTEEVYVEEHNTDYAAPAPTQRLTEAASRPETHHEGSSTSAQPTHREGLVHRLGDES